MSHCQKSTIGQAFILCNLCFISSYENSGSGGVAYVSSVYDYSEQNGNHGNSFAKKVRITGPVLIHIDLVKAQNRLPQVIVDMDSFGTGASSGRKTTNGEVDNKRVLDEDTNNNNNRNKTKRNKDDEKE